MTAQKTLHPYKLLFFVFFSIADLFLTRHLLLNNEGNVYETNPLASAWLESYGLDGLVMFKCLAMLLVVLVATYISAHRPKVGGRILVFGCLVTGFVVVYSCHLAGYFDIFVEKIRVEEAWKAEAKGIQLDQQILKEREYSVVLERRTLSEAVEELVQSEKARDPNWLEMLRQNYSNCSDPECLALHLGHHALIQIADDTRAVQRLAHQFAGELQICFGTDARSKLLELHPRWTAESRARTSWPGEYGPVARADLH